MEKIKEIIGLIKENLDKKRPRKRGKISSPLKKVVVQASRLQTAAQPPPFFNGLLGKD